MLAFAFVVFGGRIAGSHEVSHCFVTPIRDPNRGQLARSKKLRKIEGAAPVGLHPVAGLRWDQRRRNHNAVVLLGALLLDYGFCGGALFWYWIIDLLVRL